MSWSLPTRAKHVRLIMVNVPWLCWLAAVALGGLCYYFDEYGHGLYRDMRGIRDYRAEARVEDCCLWVAAFVAAIGVVMSVVGWVVIRRLGGQFKGSHQLSVGMVL